MNGLGAKVEGRAVTILVFEYVTGGGLAGRDLPASWAAEGAAMRRAIVEDFNAVPGVRVITTVDQRVPFETPGVDVRIFADRVDDRFESLATEADYTVIIAPETDGILARLTKLVERSGGRSLGSTVGAIALTTDKARLATHFERLDIPTPPTRLVDPSHGLPTEWDGPIIVKPVDGAGSVDTFVLRDPTRLPPALRQMARAVAQPYLPGIPGGASFLVDCDGSPTLLDVARQEIEVDDAGRVRYRGGTFGDWPGLDLADVKRAVDSVPGLRGFVGVDFIQGPRGKVTILEINPRPTTSYVGLARLFPPGTIAGAWLAAFEDELIGIKWPDRGPWPLTFDADGTIRPHSGDPLK